MVHFFFKGQKSLWPAKAVQKRDARLQPGILLHTALEPTELAEGPLAPHVRCCLSWEQHLSTSSPRPTTAVTPSGTRLKAHECTPARTPVYTHPAAPSAPASGMLPASRPAARKGLRSMRLPSRFSGHIDPDLCSVRLTPASPCPLLGSSQKHCCCGSALLPRQLRKAKLVAKNLAQPCSLTSPAGVCRQSQLLLRAPASKTFASIP